MTREHTFSDWIGRDFSDVGPMESTVRGAPKRRFQGLIKTRDVCERCNNERLSELDNFAKGLEMHADRAPAEPKAFSGDRDKLVRYLLKCGYNDARANFSKAQSAKISTADSAALVRQYERFAQYIVGDGTAPMDLDAVAGLLDFSASVGVGRMNVEDSESRIQFNLFLLLGAHCFYLIGWVDGTDPSYKRKILADLCAPPWNWAWLDGDPFAVHLVRVALAGAAFPSGEVVPKR